MFGGVVNGHESDNERNPGKNRMPTFVLPNCRQDDELTPTSDSEHTQKPPKQPMSGTGSEQPLSILFSENVLYLGSRGETRTSPEAAADADGGLEEVIGGCPRVRFGRVGERCLLLFEEDEGMGRGDEEFDDVGVVGDVEGLEFDGGYVRGCGKNDDCLLDIGDMQSVENSREIRRQA